MKTSARILALTFTLAAFLSGAFADTVKFGPNNTNYRIGSGGEFNLIPNGGASDPDGLLVPYNANAKLGSGANTGFETFCIQAGEHINFGLTYNYQISTAAEGSTGHDEISRGTAWLYSQFAQGTLSGYTYAPGAGRATSAGQLQKAIWFLEDEISLAGAGGTLGNSFLALIYGGSLAATAKNDAFGEFGVYALNLSEVGSTSRFPWNNQDQLVYRGQGVPDNGTTLALMGLGLLGLAGFRRIFSSAK